MMSTSRRTNRLVRSRRILLSPVRRAFLSLLVLLARVTLDGATASSASVEVGADGGIASTAAANDEVESDSPPCEDDHRDCPDWSKRGECQSNPGYMLTHCKLSCKVCVVVEENVFGMGVPQEIKGLNNAREKVRDIVQRAEAYMRDEVLVKPDYASVRATCRNQNELCAYWAFLGECEANPDWMKIHCAPVCRTCERIDIQNRCPRDFETEVDALGPGELDALFLRITDMSDPNVARYKPTILSRPSHPDDGTTTNPDDDDAPYKIGPWVVTFDDFTTPEECERLIHLGGVEGFERSTDVGKKKFDGTYDKHESTGRTSSNAWCQNDCYEDPLAQQVIGRIESLTGFPEKNSEHLQLLKYGEGQKYVTHHDFIPHHVDRAPGPRILTLFLYLNDCEAGGGTDFPTLGLTVMPKRGRALLWPSVLNDDPNRKDGRTQHQALPVERGIKYGANAWLHLRDFKTPNENGCS